MAGFKARKMKKGLFEVLGLEEFIDAKISELKRAFSGTRTAPKAKKPVAKRKAARTPIMPTKKEATPLDRIFGALAKHPRRNELVRAGKEKDQLLRSLVPLYIARTLGVEVNSGLISRFWKQHGVSYAAPNAAKALREHVGYARATKTGRQITPNGVKYVESALQRRAA
jgi:hypothetical protein